MLPIIQTHPHTVIIIEWVFGVIATIFVCLRLYVRLRRRAISPSDLMVMLTLFAFLGCCACDTIMVVKAFKDPKMTIFPKSKHSVFKLLPRQLLIDMLKTLYASSIFYYTALWFVKITLVLLYYQLLTPDVRAPWLRVYIHFTTGLVLTTYLIVLAMNIFWCMPIGLNWEVDEPEKACITYIHLDPFIISISLHLFTEVLVFAVPFRLLRHLRLDKSTRRCFLIIFGFGFSGVLVSISRVIYLFSTRHPPVISAVQSWAALEMAMGIIVVCLPAMRTLVIWMRGDSSRFYVSPAALNSALRGTRKDEEMTDIDRSDAQSMEMRKWWRLPGK